MVAACMLQKVEIREPPDTMSELWLVGLRFPDPAPLRLPTAAAAPDTIFLTLRLSSAPRCTARCRFELTRLHRISVGPIVLGDVEEGSCRELTRKEVEALYKRCLPEDPLCPTVKAVEDILASRIAHAAGRARRAAGLTGGCHPYGTATAAPLPEKLTGEVGATPTAAKVEERRAAGEEDKEEDGLGRRRASNTGRRAARKAFASAQDLTGIVELLIDFARRDLHETAPGPAGESAGGDFCPGEKESLAQARAVPPNEEHMVCGYRCSQIERLGLTYSVM